MAEVISFPKNNPRITEQDILTREEMVEKKRNLKLNFFRDAADDVVENIVRDIAALDLATITGGELNDLNAKDIIMLREALLGIMCRLTGMDHPLHRISNDIIVAKEVVDEYGDAMYDYTLKETSE